MALFVAWLACAKSVSSRVGEQGKRRMQKMAGRLLVPEERCAGADLMLRRLGGVVRALAMDVSMREG
jgi:hypothetical protein